MAAAMTRDVDPRAGALSYRQVPAYQIPNDAAGSGLDGVRGLP